MSLGENVRRLREAKGLSQQDLAVKVGVSLGSVGLWERNAVDMKLSHALALAVALDVSIADLFDGIDVRGEAA